jgi:hypothetical protein
MLTCIILDRRIVMNTARLLTKTNLHGKKTDNTGLYRRITF